MGNENSKPATLIASSYVKAIFQWWKPSSEEGHDIGQWKPTIEV